MINKHDHSIGVTPITLRRAAYYLSLGIGDYTPDHPHFDKVVVSKNYELTAHPQDEGMWATGIRVTFFKSTKALRWVDFSCQVTGAGGDSILKEIQ